MSLMRWFVCLFVGHVRTDWEPVIDVQMTYSYEAVTFVNYSSNVPSEIRFCQRCFNGYERRFAR